MKQKFSGPNPKEVSNEYESIYEPIVQAFSFDFNEENISMMQWYAVNQTSQTSEQIDAEHSFQTHHQTLGRNY